MKLIILSFSFLFAGMVFSQKVKETISTKTIGNINCTFTKNTEPNVPDAYLLKIEFSQYYSIRASISIRNKADLDMLISDLSGCITYLSSPKIKSEVVTYERPLHTFTLDGAAGTLEVMDYDRKKCLFEKNHLQEFVNYLKTVKIP